MFLLVVDRQGNILTNNFRTIEVPPQHDEDVFFNSNNNNNEFPELLPTVCQNEDTEVLECFLNLPALHEMPNPVTVVNIQNHQAADSPLQQMQMDNWQQFTIKVINQQNLICYREDPTEQQNWRIFIPHSLIQDVLRWYHLILEHCGTTKLYDTVQARFYIPGLSVYCKNFIV